MSKGDTCKSWKMLESDVTLPWIDIRILVKTMLVVTFQSGLVPSHHCVSHSSFAIEAVQQYSTALWWLCTECIASPRASRHATVFIFLAFCGSELSLHISTRHIPFVKYKEETCSTPSDAFVLPQTSATNYITFTHTHTWKGQKMPTTVSSCCTTCDFSYDVDLVTYFLHHNWPTL